MFPAVPAVTRPCFRPALQALTISRSPAGMALSGSVRPGHVAIRAACSPFRPQRVRPCSCACPPWVEAFPVLKPRACPVPVWPVHLCLLLSHAPLCTLSICAARHCSSCWHSAATKGTVCVPGGGPSLRPAWGQALSSPGGRSPSLTSRSLSCVPPGAWDTPPWGCIGAA